MGFHTGAYAKVWEVKPVGDTLTTLRISISRKNKQTGEYEQDFSGFVSFCGTSNAARAAALQEGCRIKLGDCDVSTRYVKEKDTSYTNFRVFGFEELDEEASGGGKKSGAATKPKSRKARSDPEYEGDYEDEENPLPF